jgi:hypothetical protein
MSPDDAVEKARFQINDACDAAERVAGSGAVTEMLVRMVEARRYIAAVSTPGAHVINVCARPSRSTVEQIRDLIRGK